MLCYVNVDVVVVCCHCHHVMSIYLPCGIHTFSIYVLTVVLAPTKQRKPIRTHSRYVSCSIVLCCCFAIPPEHSTSSFFVIVLTCHRPLSLVCMYVLSSASLVVTDDLLCCLSLLVTHLRYTTAKYSIAFK
jgi:hypothetical protein